MWYTLSHTINSKLHVTFISSNNVTHPVTKIFTTLHPIHFTPLHYNFRHFPSPNLNFTQIIFTTLPLRLTPFQYPTALFHHNISLHFTELLDDFHYISTPFFNPAYNCFPKSVSKNLRFKRESPELFFW